MIAVVWSGLFLAAAGCGGSSPTPTTPTEPPQEFLPDGTYRLNVRAPFGFAGCTGATENEPFLSRTVSLALTRLGDEWVARPPFPHLGDAELRLRETGGSRISALTALTGTLQGTGIIAQQSPEGGIALGVEFAGAGRQPVQVSGTAFRYGATALGGLSGTIVFIDIFREPVTCSSLEWLLVRDPFPVPATAISSR